ncbi:MAG: ThuA domain-containing protein [Isosphaeraceae bacterium]
MARRSNLIRFLLPALAMAWVAVPALAQKKNPEGARVLLLSGGQRQHHGYRDQAFYLAGVLEDTGRYEVTLNEDAALLTTPALARYDIVVALADRRDPEFKYTEAQQKALLDFVRAGKGYVSIHGADNAAPDWLPEWREMLGAVFSHDTKGGKYPDGKVLKGTYSIRITQPDHPITNGLDAFQLKDELYYHLQMESGVEPLAVAQHDGKDWPVAWTRDFGKGKVFHTPLGHRDFGNDKDDPLRDPNLGKLVIRGIDWVAAGIGKARP